MCIRDRHLRYAERNRRARPRRRTSRRRRSPALSRARQPSYFLRRFSAADFARLRAARDGGSLNRASPADLDAAPLVGRRAPFFASVCANSSLARSRSSGASRSPLRFAPPDSGRSIWKKFEGLCPMDRVSELSWLCAHGFLHGCAARAFAPNAGVEPVTLRGGWFTEPSERSAAVRSASPRRTEPSGRLLRDS